MQPVNSGFWATPNTMDSLPPKSKEAIMREATIARPGRTQTANLRDQVNGLWPTPKSVEVNETPEQWEKRRQQPKQKMNGMSLTVAAKLMPTPRSRDWKGQTQRGIFAPQDSLANMNNGHGKVIGGALNPDWVEWLMGFPVGWTDLKD